MTNVTDFRNQKQFLKIPNHSFLKIFIGCFIIGHPVDENILFMLNIYFFILVNSTHGHGGGRK